MKSNIEFRLSTSFYPENRSTQPLDLLLASICKCPLSCLSSLLVLLLLVLVSVSVVVLLLRLPLLLFLFVLLLLMLPHVIRLVGTGDAAAESRTREAKSCTAAEAHPIGAQASTSPAASAGAQIATALEAAREAGQVCIWDAHKNKITYPQAKPFPVCRSRWRNGTRRGDILSLDATAICVCDEDG